VAVGVDSNVVPEHGVKGHRIPRAVREVAAAADRDIEGRCDGREGERHEDARGALDERDVARRFQFAQQPGGLVARKGEFRHDLLDDGWRRVLEEVVEDEFAGALGQAGISHAGRPRCRASALSRRKHSDCLPRIGHPVCA
jgi:hypothetical protein